MKWQREMLILVVAALITPLSSLLLVDAFTTLSSIATQQHWRLKSVLLQNDNDTFEDDNVITSLDSRGYIQQQRRRDFISLLSSSNIIIPLSAAAAITSEEEKCRHGSIMTESPVPGAYSQVCMNLDERTFTLTSIKEDNSITVSQGTNSGAGEVAGRTGGKIKMMSI